MKALTKIFLVFALLCNANLLFAQQEAEMADSMRANGKIYIVVAVCLTILIGLFIYVWNVDRKIGKIEQESK